MNLREHEPHHSTDDSSNEGADYPCHKAKGSVPAESSESKLSHYAVLFEIPKSYNTSMRTHTAHTNLFTGNRDEPV